MGGVKGSDKGVKGILGIDPEVIEGEASAVVQAELDGLRPESDDEAPQEVTLEEVWRRDEGRAGAEADELGHAAVTLEGEGGLMRLIEAFPGAELIEDESTDVV